MSHAFALVLPALVVYVVFRLIVLEIIRRRRLKVYRELIETAASPDWDDE